VTVFVVVADGSEPDDFVRLDDEGTAFEPASCTDAGTLAKTTTSATASTIPQARAAARPRNGRGELADAIACLPWDEPVLIKL
jgi:hypothetical protein